MKSIRLKTQPKHIFLPLVAAVIILIFSTCATKAPFLTSTVVPAARGAVTVTNDKNNNYVIKVKISNLAESGRLEQSNELYIVWMQTEDNTTKNMGQIISTSGFMSKELKATFETVTSVRPTKIFITTESDVNSQYPSGPVVLTTNSF